MIEKSPVGQLEATLAVPYITNIVNMIVMHMITVCRLINDDDNDT